MATFEEIFKVTRTYLFDPNHPDEARKKMIGIDDLLQAYDKQTAIMILISPENWQTMAVLPKDLKAALRASLDYGLHLDVKDIAASRWTWVKYVYNARSGKIEEWDPAQIADKTDQNLLIYKNDDWFKSHDNNLGVITDALVIPGQEAAFERAFPQFKRAENTHDWRYYLI